MSESYARSPGRRTEEHLAMAKAMADDSDSSQWVHNIFRVAVTAAAHPIEYIKVLIQLGYEPLPPRPTTTFFGKPALALPGVFEYMGYVRKREGFFGLYRGVVPRVCGSVLSGYVFNKVTESIQLDVHEEDDEFEVRTTEDKVTDFLQITARDMLGRTVAVISTQPFQVIAVRSIAQFVGGETVYNGLISAFKEIYSNEGIFGFFSGLGPRILAEVLSLWISSSLTFVVNNYLVEDNDFKGYTSASMAFIASAITYPLNLVSNILAVNKCGLAAGSPPNMPLYHSWKDCWRHLSSQNQLKRGSSLLWRYYTGPYVLMEGSNEYQPDNKLKQTKPPVKIGTHYNITVPALPATEGKAAGRPKHTAEGGNFRSSYLHD